MEPFLLNVEAHPNGTTTLTVDAGPTKRVQVLTLTENAHTTLDTPVSQLLAHSLSEVRPPTRRRDMP